MAIFAVAGVVFLFVSHAASTAVFSDNFSNYATGTCMPDGTVFGKWKVAFAGYGCTKVITDSSGTNWLQEKPATSTSPSQTHSALTTGPSFTAPYTLSTDMRTTQQTRTGSTPNPWEVGWLLWDYSDNTHFYYFTPKANGWELGKEDPAYPGNQRFLATGSTPMFAIGQKLTVAITQDATNTITVTVNGTKVTQFTDSERPYTSGNIGLYSEDAVARFTNVSVSVPTTSSTGGTGTTSGGTTGSTGSTGTGFTPAGMRTLPDPLYGMTIDNGLNGASPGDSAMTNIINSAKALTANNRGRLPISRFVFDENTQPSDYTTAVQQVQPYSYIMGELLDSQYMSTYTVTGIHNRVASFLSAFPNTVDLWEVGNEINGEWLGTTSDVVSKMTDAYNQVKAAGKRTELTLYYNPNCYSNASNEMFTWAQNNIPDSMKQGLDYVLISYYEQDCNNFRPTQAQAQAVFDRLHAMFPNARLGFGEVGLGNGATVSSSNLAKAQDTLTYYYGLAITGDNYVGGYFWWNYYEDMLPYNSASPKPMWATLNTAIQKY